MAAAGAAYFAGLSCGVWKGLDDIKRLDAVYDTFFPSIAGDQRAKIVKRWNKALKAVLRSYYA